MTTQRPIDSVVILDGNIEALRIRLAEVRPDLKLFEPGVDKAQLQGRQYAIIAFNPGECINDFADSAWIHCSGAGTDYLLESLQHPVPLITRTVGQMGQQIAEYVLAYALWFKQRIEPRLELQKAQLWDQLGACPQNLAGSRALIFGTGAIGCPIADALRGVSVRCDGVSKSGQLKSSFDKVISFASLDPNSLQEYEIVVLALPNLSSTRSLIDRQVLQGLNTALLINVGRAQVLVLKDLLCAIDQGRIAQVVLDVFEHEPLPESSSLWRHPKIVITPHVAGVTEPGDAINAFVAALERLEAGRQPDLQVFPQRSD